MSSKSDFFILIPPSEGKISTGESGPLKILSTDTKNILGCYKNFKGDQSALYGLKHNALNYAIETNSNIENLPTTLAINRYNGVVYKALDFSSLDAPAKAYVNRHVRIVSALFGLITPYELIPNYKIKINKFGIDKYWMPINQKIIKDRYCVDLLPQAFKKAARINRGVEIEFIFKNGSKFLKTGHQGKSVKGRFVRFLARKNVGKEAFIDFERLSNDFLKEETDNNLILEKKEIN